MKLLITTLTTALILSNTIWAQRNPSQSSESLTEDFAKRASAKLAGRVIWKKHDLSHTTVQVYKDERLKQLYTAGVLKRNRFEIRVEPGSYYLVAFVDTDGSGKFDVGDGMGILGITNWNAPNQKKQLITVGDRQTISALDIVIAARMQNIDGQNKIISVDNFRENPLDKFKKELSLITSGVKGTVKRESQNPSESGLVFAYTDLSWKYRAGGSKLEADGSFTLHLIPGKYYLMVVIDKNRTNLFDAGDELGMYGIANLRDRRAFPKPVLVEHNKFTEGLEIEIVGQQISGGKIIPRGEEGTANQKGGNTSQSGLAQVSGRVVWEGGNQNAAIVEVHRDPTLVKPLQQLKTDKDGNFRLQLPPGDYYLMANVDADSDGRVSAGDGIGSYGTADITTQPPAVLTFKQGKNPDLQISVSGQYNADGQLEPIAPADGDEDNLSPIDSGISGRVSWDSKEFREGILSISDTPDFQSVIPISLNLAADGRYEIALPPGDYYVMVLVDLDADRKAGLRDGIGIYGTTQPVRGEPQRVSVFPGYITPHIDIEIFAAYIDTKGNIAEIENGHRPNIKLQYGEPEDIFKFTRLGRQIEEWWYWTQGVQFSFEAVGAGWKLQNRTDFESKVSPAEFERLKQELERKKSGNKANDTTGQPDANAPDTEELGFDISRLNALIYFTADGIIWGYAPDANLQPLGAGRNPTASMSGRLTYLDTQGNVIILHPDAPEGELLLDRRELATEAVISPDGKSLAFSRHRSGRKRIYIQNLGSGQELPVPSTAQEMFSPAWNFNGKLLAYSARGSIENPNAGKNTNIYVYDRISNRIQPIRIGEGDDSEPAWSPARPRLLAFSRAEGEHRQIWRVEFSPDGEPNEQQLTRYGGENPVWLPDGSSILYENNGQLWMVSADGIENQPIRLNGKVVFGHAPYVLPFK